MADDTPARPTIDLSPARVMCPRHGEPFRPNWPAGYAVFTVRGFEVLLAEPEIADATGGAVERVGPLLDARPMCCRLPSLKLLRLYEEVQEKARPWPVARCRNCDKVRFGCEYRTRGQVVRHLCLRCVVFSLKVAN